MITDLDRTYLRRCVELAGEALAAGDQPFGSVLVDGAGNVRQEARNLVGGGDHTQHPELALAQWAAAHVPADDRPACTVYTSGEHCPMCAAAHGWAGLGRIVYAHSSAQLGEWLGEFGVAPSPVVCLPIQDLVPGIAVDGPDDELAEEMREMHRRYYQA